MSDGPPSRPEDVGASAQTLVLGIDGGEWDVLDPLIEAGRLPNLARLVDDGVSGRLASVTPPVSPPAWTTIQTGVNPGKHGIYDFVAFDPDHSRRVLDATDRRSPPFWRLLNDRGVSTGVFKVPFSYPPDDVEGFLVSGFPTPATAGSYGTPAAVADQLPPTDDLFEDKSLLREGDLEAFGTDLVRTAERQTAVLLDLLEGHETDLVATVYDGADRVQHYFWKYLDEDHPRYTDDERLAAVLPEYFEAVDEGIGRTIDAMDDELNVVVLSDHGFGPLSYDVYVEEWLASNDYLRWRDRNSARRSVRDTASRTVSRVWDVMKSAGLAPTVGRLAPTWVLDPGRRLLESADSGNASWDQVDWSGTRAFFTSTSGQSLVINLDDRFDRGTVSRSRYDDVVESLADELSGLRDPETGQGLVEAVHRTDELYEAPASTGRPDLVVETGPEYTLKGGRSDALVEPSTQFRRGRSGDHRPHGMFVAAGPSFGTGSVSGLHLADVAPLLLSLHRCPIAPWMDGEVPTEVYADAARPAVERADRGTYDVDQVPEDTGISTGVKDQLEDLGYLD
jgi:predicted AlkP superfamily phosphohydrolase/phosphomutase